MNELIKITYNNDRPAVSARDLHDFLEVDTPLSQVVSENVRVRIHQWRGLFSYGQFCP